MYFIKRIFLIVPTLLCLSLLCFFLLQIMPGSPLTSTQTERFAPSASLSLSYVDWLGDLVKGDWGKSFYYGSSVLKVLAEAVAPTLALTFSSMFFSYLAAIFFGVLMTRSRVWDHLFSGLLVLYSVPNFVLGIALLTLFNRYFPLQGIVSHDFASFSTGRKILDLGWHLTLPVLSIMIVSIPYLAVLVKNALLEELSQDYIRAAQARGVGNVRLLLTHASRGVLFTLSTSLGREVGWLLSGTLFIETLFGIPGIGKLAFDSFLRRDTPVLMGIVLVAGMMQVAGNLISDFLYQALHPKVRFT